LYELYKNILLFSLLLTCCGLYGSTISELEKLKVCDNEAQQQEVSGKLDEAFTTYINAISDAPIVYEVRFAENIKDLAAKHEKNKLDSLPNVAQWHGEDLKDKAIYVYSQMGIGDSIQFVRFLHPLSSLGAKKIVFKTSKFLIPLFKNSYFKNVSFLSGEVDKTEKFDFQVSLLALPSRLKMKKTDDVPHKDTYLKATKEKVESYKKKFFDNDYTKVGIVWRGAPGHINDKNRSVPLSLFYDLAKIKNVKLYSLQKGCGEEQLADATKDIEIVDVGNTFNDFSDTAAAIENCDYIISVDTAVAHLGGALGKPTWILIPFVSDWRWFLKGETSYWYDSVKLFRQEAAGNWSDIFKSVTAELK
jgi:hypothetical protein